MKRDPTTSLQKKNNDLIEKLYKENVITNLEKFKLTKRTTNAPRIYGLPKIHKEDVPLRPICSSINSPSYDLCKYIMEILNRTKYNIKDAIETKKRINNTYISDDEVMVSFDVISLFPSIPLDN